MRRDQLFFVTAVPQLVVCSRDPEGPPVFRKGDPLGYIFIPSKYLKLHAKNKLPFLSCTDIPICSHSARCLSTRKKYLLLSNRIISKLNRMQGNLQMSVLFDCINRVTLLHGPRGKRHQLFHPSHNLIFPDQFLHPPLYLSGITWYH